MTWIVVAIATRPKSAGTRYQARTKVLSAESPLTMARDRLSHMLPWISRSVTLLIDEWLRTTRTSTL